MTVQEIIETAWRDCGSPSQITPYSDFPDNTTFDITTDGSIQMLAYLNRGYKALCFWKISSGRQLRFPITFDNLYFTSSPITGTAQAGAASTITLASSEVTADDAFNGYLIEITGGTGSNQKRIIIDSAVTTDVCTVHKAWDTNPDATSTYKIAHHQYKILASGHAEAANNIVVDPINTFFAPEQVNILTSGRPLYRSSNKVPQVSNRETFGEPNVFYWDQNSIWFDTAPDTALTFELEYRRMPADLSLATDEPTLPEIWHEAVTYYVMHEIYRFLQESQEAYAVKRDLESLVSRLAQPDETAYEKINGIVELP